MHVQMCCWWWLQWSRFVGDEDEEEEDADSFIWAVPGINVSLGGSRAAVALAEVTPSCVFENRNHDEEDMKSTHQFMLTLSPSPTQIT